MDVATNKLIVHRRQNVAYEDKEKFILYIKRCWNNDMIIVKIEEGRITTDRAGRPLRIWIEMEFTITLPVSGLG